MMISKPSLKNSAKPGLSLLLALLLLSGCSSSTKPTYSKKDIEGAIQNICLKEYKIKVKVKLVGATLWVYFPVENIIEKTDKPEKYIERFTVEYSKDVLREGVLKAEYLVRVVPEKEKHQPYQYNKAVFEKINNIWMVIRRVVFSLDHRKEEEPKFFCLVAADIKNGFEIKETFYYLDLKKFAYGFISLGEYQHRAIQETAISAEIIGDTQGKHLNYEDITLAEFIIRQIDQRIRLTFQKPEAQRNADIDKEIAKIVVKTLKIYDFKNFRSVELYNLFTNRKTTLSQTAIWIKPSD